MYSLAMGEIPGPPPQHSNYPRYNMPWQGPGTGAVPPGPPTVRFGAIGEAWNLVRQDLGTWAVAWLLFVIIYYAAIFVITIVMAVAFPETQSSPWSPEAALLQTLMSFVSMAVYYPMLGGIFWMCLKRLRGERYSLADVFEGFKYALPLVVVGFLTSLLTIVGLFLLIIPMFYVIGVTAFAPLIAIDQRVGGIEALRRSYHALRGEAWMMFALVFITGIIAGLGACACLVGILFTLPIYSFVIALHYHAFFPPAGEFQAQQGHVMQPPYSI
jgi:hypothetical protein